MNNEIIGFVDGYKGVKLFYKACLAQQPKAKVIFLHGAGEYTEKYAYFAQWFVDKGIDVFMPDLRGHGRSGGAACHVDNFNDYAKDLDIFIKFTDKGWGNKKTFLTAHSLGALISVFYTMRFTYDFKGLILCSPCFKLRLKIAPVKAWFAAQLYDMLGSRSFSSHIKPQMATHDRQIIEKFAKDPLMHHFVTASFFVEMNKAMKIARRAAGDFKMPLAVLQAGHDRICDSKAAERFYESAASQDKEFKLYRGFYHELLNETKKEEVFIDIYDWIIKRC